MSWDFFLLSCYSPSYYKNVCFTASRAPLKTSLRYLVLWVRCGLKGYNEVFLEAAPYVSKQPVPDSD